MGAGGRQGVGAGGGQGVGAGEGQAAKVSQIPCTENRNKFKTLDMLRSYTHAGKTRTFTTRPTLNIFTTTFNKQ